MLLPELALLLVVVVVAAALAEAAWLLLEVEAAEAVDVDVASVIGVVAAELLFNSAGTAPDASFLGFGGGSLMVKSGSPREMEVVGMAECGMTLPGVLMPGV